MKSAPHTLSVNPFNAAVIYGYVELTKPGITLLVLASMIIGFILGSPAGIQFGVLAHAIIGTTLIAAGTAAHNQFIERDLDKLMLRTSKRPLPAEKIAPKSALIFSLTLMLGGLLYLVFLVNTAAGIVSAITTLIYLAVYTPLKRVSFTNVMIGAVPGALPPVGGWAAATGNVLDPGMWVLFAIVFFWQIPHVLAIAWLCNEDYTRAGFRMLPKGDKTGMKSAVIVLICLLSLLPVSAMLYWLGFNSVIYLAGVLAGGGYFLYFGLKFIENRNRDNARKLMFGSLVYLPVVWVFIILDRLVTLF